MGNPVQIKLLWSRKKGGMIVCYCGWSKAIIELSLFIIMETQVYCMGG